MLPLEIKSSSFKKNSKIHIRYTILPILSEIAVRERFDRRKIKKKTFWLTSHHFSQLLLRVIMVIIY
jgi:hypothetical protein